MPGLHRRRRSARSHRAEMRLGERHQSSPASTAQARRHASSVIPFLDRDSLGILGDHVTLEQGTGAVHTAPGHGQEDYVVGRQYGMPVYCPVDAAGRFFQAEGAPARFPQKLHRQNRLGRQSHRHRDPEGTRRPARHGKDRPLLSALLALPQPDHLPRHRTVVHRHGQQRSPPEGSRRHQPVKWMPEWGEERISNMVATRPDWCISRQRVWGVPIIVFYCDSAAIRSPTARSSTASSSSSPSIRPTSGSSAPRPN